jgi:hypothetical protein
MRHKNAAISIYVFPTIRVVRSSDIILGPSSSYAILYQSSLFGRKLNMNHSTHRNMCSSLNADLHLVNLKPSPACLYCHGEDCIHFFFECPFYN